ncbi:MAG: nucleoside-diphosphate-sugar epimerase [Nitriliruptoraceae bacterium]|jgi:nucleoside-diphosphate-sugar epimerase
MPTLPIPLPAGAVVLVTGANGFIGHRICLRLAQAGTDTRAMVRQAGALPSAAAHITELVASWDDPDALAAAMVGVTHVVHCFAIAGPDHDAAVRVNVEGTRVILDAAAAASVQRVVHISTTSVVSPHALVIDDLAELADDAAGPYSVTKRDGEVVVAQAQAAGLDTVILRPPAVLGWGESSTWGQKFPVWVRDGAMPFAPDPRACLGWVFVDDFADAIASALTAPDATGNTYVIASGTATWGAYMTEVLSWLDDVADPLVPGDEIPPIRRWSSERAATDLGWTPTHTFAEAMAESAPHHRSTTPTGAAPT